ncbi:hypothetical protein UlMin_010457 [Ulmus minor]
MVPIIILGKEKWKISFMSNNFIYQCLPFGYKLYDPTEKKLGEPQCYVEAVENENKAHWIADTTTIYSACNKLKPILFEEWMANDYVIFVVRMDGSIKSLCGRLVSLMFTISNVAEVSTPNEEECFQIIKLYTKKIPMDSSADLQVVAASCNGYFGADLEALCRKASISAIKYITRGVTVEIPKVTWEDIGGLRDLKLQQAVEWPFKHSTSFTRLGITLVHGILLHGHPGCSKTTLAKDTAHVAQACFFSLSGVELYSTYVGDGEPLLRNTFQRALLVAPRIIFFDEADVVTVLVGSSLLARISSSTPAIINASCLSAEGCCCC